MFYKVFTTLVLHGFSNTKFLKKKFVTNLIPNPCIVELYLNPLAYI